MGQKECRKILKEMSIPERIVNTTEELSEFRDRVIQDSKEQLKNALINFIKRL